VNLASTSGGKDKGSGEIVHGCMWVAVDRLEKRAVRSAFARWGQRAVSAWERRTHVKCSSAGRFRVGLRPLWGGGSVK
jgi:hypothetical protein